MAWFWLWDEAAGSSRAFSGGSGWCGRCTELAQKAGCVTLHLTWRQQQGLCGVRLAMPGWTQRLDLASHEQQLGVGQRTQPHPAFDPGELGSLVGIEAQVLFQKAESMFDSKPPQLHAAEIGQGQFA